MADPSGFPDVEGQLESAGSSVPQPDVLSRAELVLILGSLASPERAQQLAGVVALAVEEGAVVVVAYPVSLGNEQFVIQTITPEVTYQAISPTEAVTARHPLFRRYLSIFGRTSFGCRLEGEVEVLGYPEGRVMCGRRPIIRAIADD